MQQGVYMEHYIIYGYKVPTGDFIKCVGMILTALLAFSAVFINNYFAIRRLKEEIKNKNNQDQLDKTHRVEVEKLKNHLSKIEEVFYFTLELQSAAFLMREYFDKIEDIASLLKFCTNIELFSKKLQTLDNKIWVVCNVYLYDSLISTSFVSYFNVNLHNFPLDVTPVLDEALGTEAERFANVLMELKRFSSKLDCFINDISNFEKCLLDEIADQQERVA
jgi:hypothetical protein